MTLPSFGLREPAAVAHALPNVVNANNQALAQMGMDLLAPLYNAVSLNDAALGATESAVRKKLNGAVRSNTRKLQPIAQQLFGELMSKVNGVNRALGGLRSGGIILPGEGTCPPGQMIGEDGMCQPIPQQPPIIPTPPPTPGNWWCIQEPGQFAQCQQFPPGTAPAYPLVPAGTTICGGPFDTCEACQPSAEAINGFPSHCVGGPLPPPITPPPVTPPPPCDPNIDPNCIPTPPPCPPCPPTEPCPECPPPCPPVISVGDSCDNPLYIVLCPPPGTTTPPTTPPPQECQPGQHWDDTQQQCVPDEQPPQPPPPPPQPTPIGLQQPCVTDSLVSLQNIITQWVNGLSLPSTSNFAGVLGQIPIVGWIIQQIITAGALDWSNIQATVGCEIPTTTGLTVARWLLGFLDHWGIIMPEVVRVMTYGVNTACPTELPSAGDANNAWIWAGLDDDTWKYWVTANGKCPGPWSKVLYAEREKPTADEIIRFAKRIEMDDEQISSILTYYGFIDQGEAAVKVALSWELPTIADQLQFLTRNVYDTAYVEDYELLEGFEERFWATAGPSLRAIGISEEVAALHYAAHWINPAPTELREFVYRLRPDKPGVENPFTPDDYARLLVEQDVSPYMRARFQETIYRVPALGYVRDMYRNYILEDDELKSIHQDLGYSDENSDRFVRIDQLTRARMRASEGRGWDPTAIAHGYISRVLQREDVFSYMGALGFTRDESISLMDRARSDLEYTVFTRARSRMMFAALSTVKSAITAGVMDQLAASQALQQLGWPQQYADAWAGITVDSANVALVKQAQSRIRSEYLGGSITIEQAGSALGSLGVVPSAAQQLLAVWQLEFTQKRKRRSAGQIVNDVANDEMTVGEAYVRLTNLGYPDADSRLFLADAQRKILAREESLAAKQQRSDLAAAREMARTLSLAEKQQAELLAALKRISPPSKLQKWARLGIIGRDLFFERMRTFKYDDSDIERWYEEACAAKGSTCSETTPTTPSPPPGARGPGFPG